MLAFSTLKKI